MIIQIWAPWHHHYNKFLEIIFYKLLNDVKISKLLKASFYLGEYPSRNSVDRIELKIKSKWIEKIHAQLELQLMITAKIVSYIKSQHSI